MVHLEPAATVSVRMYQGGGRRGGGWGGGRGWGGGGGGGSSSGWNSRGGGGGGRFYGRGGPANNRGGRGTWERKPEQDAAGKKTVATEDAPKQDTGNENWEKAVNKAEEKQADVEAGVQDNQVVANQGKNDLPPHEANPNHQRVPCENCGLFNHATKDCRRQFCEFCGFSNHSTYECRRCVLWNMGPKLCAAQVEDQSFFYIDECIDPRVSKEECIGVINVLQGKATSKQIEQQFMMYMGSSSWKWNARQVASNRFMMRFPNAKMVTEWSRVRALAMTDVDAQIKVEQWFPKIGAKAVLQQAWFSVFDIPADQRSIRTIAKVGGLVGKVMEIDEATRYRADYVRIKIACRDVQKVPRSAEATLGLYVKAFIFE